MVGSTKSSKRVADWLGRGTVFWAQAPAAIASAISSRFTASKSTVAAVAEPTSGPPLWRYPIGKPPRDVRDDLDAIVTLFVDHHAAVAVHACDALAVVRVVGIKGQRHANDVER